MNRPLTQLAAGLVCAVALAGCSSDSTSSDSPASSPSPSVASSAPVPSDSLPGPDLPSAARGESRDAAKAFVEYWVETLNYATDTGDTRLLKALATKNCDACTAFAATLDEIYAKGGHVESNGWQLKSAVPMADQPASAPAFQLDVKFEPQTVFQTENSKPKDYPGGEQPARMVLTRQDGRWLVEKLDI